MRSFERHCQMIVKHYLFLWHCNGVLKTWCLCAELLVVQYEYNPPETASILDPPPRKNAWKTCATKFVKLGLVTNPVIDQLSQ